MLKIRIKFLTGRYHATPWDRHVNEGVAEWPPAPYRLVRALISVWKRYFPEWPENRVLPVLGFLGGCPPFYHLPPTTESHTRSYLDINNNLKFKGKIGLVFDAFRVFNPENPVIIGFPGDLPAASVSDLDTLLKKLRYFGRSESWVQAEVCDGPDPEWNCLPVNHPETKGELVSVSCVDTNRDEWYSEVCLSTADINEKGWSDPPALIWVDYLRPPTIRSQVGRNSKRPGWTYRAAHYAITPKPVRIPVTKTVILAERIRSVLMGTHRRIMGGDKTLVSSRFSGKDKQGRALRNNHQHTFFLPLDEDGDGWLDHVRIISREEPFSETEMEALDRLNKIWYPEVHLVLVGIESEPYPVQAQSWTSATPYIPTRHYRRGRGDYEEWLQENVLRECKAHGLPKPIAICRSDDNPSRWAMFVRNRKNKTPKFGTGISITFPEPIAGPFGLGRDCHFGLGLFQPKGNQSKS